MDGGLFEYYVCYWLYMEEVFQELMGFDVVYEVVLRLQNDGFGIGVVLFVVFYLYFKQDKMYIKFRGIMVGDEYCLFCMFV